MKVLKLHRWTIEQASAEFNIDRKTLSKALRRASLEAGEDYKFSTAQICTAIFGDLEAEQILKIREERETIAIKKKNLLHQLMPSDAVEKIWGGVMITLRQKISACEAMTDAEKREILSDLQNIPIDEYFTDSGGEVEEDPEESA